MTGCDIIFIIMPMADIFMDDMVILIGAGVWQGKMHNVEVPCGGVVRVPCWHYLSTTNMTT